MNTHSPRDCISLQAKETLTISHFTIGFIHTQEAKAARPLFSITVEIWCASFRVRPTNTAAENAHGLCLCANCSI